MVELWAGLNGSLMSFNLFIYQFIYLLICLVLYYLFIDAFNYYFVTFNIIFKKF